MIFLLNKKEIIELEKLFQTREYNINVNSYLNDNVISFNANIEDINEYKIKELNINDYIDDEYFKNVKPNEVILKQLKLSYESYPSNTSFLFDESKIDENDYYLTINQIGYFKGDYRFLTIQKDNVIWMSIIPHEINTMKEIISKANGNVYVLGLGLGYFAYKVANLNSVTNVTIIDNDSNLITLFKNNIFNSFDNKNKFKFINIDAFKYLSNINKNDFIFIDLWHNEIDGLLTYIKLKRLLKDYSNVHYWIEKSLLNALRNLLIILIEEEFYKVEANYNLANNENEIIINAMHNYLKNKTFKTYDEIKEFLKDNNLKKLIIDLNI